MGLKMTVLETLNWATNYLEDHGVENPRLNAELLLAHSLKLSREGLYIHLRDGIQREEKETLAKIVERRVSGEPLQYILGHQEFWSIDLKVDPRVLVPRPETELLVDQSLSILAQRHSKKIPLVLEIGTGSGAIAISLASGVGDILIVATDISRDALLLAKENARSAGVLGQIVFINGDLFAPFHFFSGEGPFDLILSNPPYISRPEIQTIAREVRDYEPIIALYGGEDGLEFYRRIVSQASFYLRKGGWLLVEVGAGQGAKVSELIDGEEDFMESECLRDLSGIERVVKAQKNNPEIRSTGEASRRDQFETSTNLPLSPTGEREGVRGR